MKEKDLNLFLSEFMKSHYEKSLLEDEDNIVMHNLPFFYKLSCILDEYNKNNDSKRINAFNTDVFSKMNFEDKIELLKDFFNEINIDINIDELINLGYMKGNYLDGKIYKIKKYGNCYVSCDGKNIVFPNGNLTLDIIYTAHELGHYLNVPKKEEKTGILSEAVAIYIELMMNDYLDCRGYYLETNFSKNERKDDLKKCSKGLTNIIESLLTYITFGKVNIENYNTLFKDKDYEKFLKEIPDKKHFDKFLFALRYVFGFQLASYMKYMVSIDYSFTQNITNFYKRINDYSLIDCLKELNIYNLDDDFFEQLKNIITNENYLKDINKKNVR